MIKTIDKVFSLNLTLFFLIGRFRQYGLWERYAELYPNGDLVYMIGTSNYTKDWFLAQVTRFEYENYMFLMILSLKMHVRITYM